jgi:SAM-dependent methyltransferase
MSTIAQTVMKNFYRKAEGDPQRLPWHRDAPSRLLTSAVASRQGRGRVLDVGCGAGTFSVFLAKQGMDVTGIDIFPEATAMAQRLAARHNVDVKLIDADLFGYVPERRFDLVLDSGCLHSLVGGNVATYKAQLLRWLVPGGDFVLEHWGKRHALDWRPIGPRRRSQATIERIFAPEFDLVESEVTDFPTPLPFGPTVRGIEYWFRRR